jgi:hypothetical protein
MCHRRFKMINGYILQTINEKDMEGDSKKINNL